MSLISKTVILKYLNNLNESKNLKFSFYILIIASVILFCKDTLAVENNGLSKKLELYDAIG